MKSEEAVKLELPLSETKRILEGEGRKKNILWGIHGGKKPSNMRGEEFHQGKSSKGPP